MRGQTLRSCGSAFQAQLFAGRPDKSDVAALQVGAKRPCGGDQGGAADAIIERARRGAAAHQLVILLGNGDKVAGLDAERGNVFRIARADIHVKHHALAARPLKAGLVPAFRQLQHARNHVRAGVDHGSVTQEICQHAAAFGFEFKPAIGQDGVDFIADFIHVRHHGDARLLRAGRICPRRRPNATPDCPRRLFRAWPMRAADR